MKDASSYSFQSPLPFDEIRARLRGLGPWQWAEAGVDSVVANVPAPDRGTLTIAVDGAGHVVVLAIEAAPENLQAIYDTLFTHVLPAISASDVGPPRQAPPVQSGRARLFAYTFDTTLGLREMFAALNAAGPWTWSERDNDRLGDYISAGALHAPHRGVVKIFVEDGAWTVQAELSSEQPDAEAVVANAERELFERVLPTIGARILVEVEPWE